MTGASAVSYTHLDVYKRQVRDRIKILRSEATGQWSIREKNADRSNVKANTTYGTRRMSAYHILEQTLNPVSYTHLDVYKRQTGF